MLTLLFSFLVGVWVFVLYLQHSTKITLFGMWLSSTFAFVITYLLTLIQQKLLFTLILNL